MISVDEVIMALLRVNTEVPGCAGRCGACSGAATSAANSLGVFGGKDGGASASLYGAVNHLGRAQGALEQLRGEISVAVSRLSR